MIKKLFLLIWLILPISAAATEIDFSEAKRFAELANAIYGDRLDVMDYVEVQKGKLVRYKTIPDTQVAYVLWQNEDNSKQKIAIRGTANLENVIVDLKFKMQPDQIVGIPIHQGFSSSATAVFKDMQSYLSQEHPIDITGHSLGGAIAAILALYLDYSHYSVDKVMTFGQPKVTNVAGASLFDHLDIIRFVTPLDMVPIVPPLDPLEIKNTDIFWHSGTAVILLEGINYSTVKGIPAMLRGANFLTAVPGEENLAHHKMTYYLELIEAKRLNSNEIPFKNDIGILDWFSE